MKNAKWVWCGEIPGKNEFAYFRTEFFCNGPTRIRICADTEYVAFVNGSLATFNVFAGYPELKYYNDDDITALCTGGANVLEITARYEGVDSLTHIASGGGLIFEVESGGKTVAFSSEDTPSCVDARYLSYNERRITWQLGLSADMVNAQNGELHKSFETAVKCRLMPRPVGQLELGKFVPGREIRAGLYDLGKETVGYLRVSVNAKSGRRIKIAFGEHVADGKVRRLVGGRDFSLDFYCGEGLNEFTNYFVRVGARYLEIVDGDPGDLISVGLVPCVYPLTLKKRDIPSKYWEIYNVCVDTLRLSMHNHYEDCPWREQALYVLDSRNQMLCGYYCFEETDFQRANLVFMKNGRMKNGLLELTYPAVNTPAIPFFSLMYPVAVREYVDHTSDRSIIDEVSETMRGILDGISRFRQDDGLIHNPPAPFWNFYEWTDTSDGHGDTAGRADLILNCAYVLSARAVCSLLGEDCEKYAVAETLAAIKKFFFSEKTGLFRSSDTVEKPTRTGQAFALLCGLGDRRTVEALKNAGIEDSTLSMMGFVYDALIENGGSTNTEYVLDDIYKKYSYMLSQGATSFWETLDGEKAFDNAGSLCHGWSAIHVKYIIEHACERE